jgi:hypothetical protein
MPQYLVAIHLPDNYDPSLEGEAMVRDIDVLNEEMDAAGARREASTVRRASASPCAATISRSRRGVRYVSRGRACRRVH